MLIVPYVPATISEPVEVVQAIRARRGGGLFNLDRMLLHSPPFARGWNVFMGAVRSELTVSPKLRELAICVVAILNRADYEFGHHAPEFVQAGGTDAQVVTLRDPARAASDSQFSPLERAVIRLTIEMTRDIEVSRDLMRELREALPAQALIELIGIIAAYNMVSRFLVATGITPE